MRSGGVGEEWRGVRSGEGVRSGGGGEEWRDR